MICLLSYYLYCAAKRPVLSFCVRMVVSLRALLENCKRERKFVKFLQEQRTILGNPEYLHSTIIKHTHTHTLTHAGY